MAGLQFLAADWPAVSRLLDEVLELPIEKRAAWLDALAEPDAVRATLRRLLAEGSGHETAAFLAEMPRLTIGAASASGHPGAAAVHAGATIGPYRLISELGVGGMATVWLAEQTSGVLRRVALKIPHLGLEEGSAAARRFIQERDFLAALEHPNIARLYDAGVSEDGVAYLAMELISGAGIQAYCDGQALGLLARLALFDQVLSAVGHAHAHLVIHRDLKPGNILVTPDRQVKLLDFGIASLMEEDTAPESAMRADSRVFTPDFASPEQLGGQPLATTSDVYSLGVVLYELMTGRRPYRLDARAGDLAGQLRRQVVHRPSGVAFDDFTARARATTPSGLRRALSVDLDAIVLKAIHLETSHRYAGVADLARDLKNHAADRPVAAVPPSAAYLASRFALRNRWLLASAGAVGMALVTGLGVALWQAHEAQLQAARAREVQAFIKQIFRASAPEQAQGRDIGARELLTRGGAGLETQLQNQPELLAEFQAEIGEILLELGANAEARPYLEKAVAAFDKGGRPDSEEALRARLRLSDVLINEAQWGLAREVTERLLDLARTRFGRLRPAAVEAQSSLAFIRTQQGDPGAAARILEQALADQRKTGAPMDHGHFMMQSDLGAAYMAQERYADARDASVQALADWSAVPGALQTEKLVCRLNINYARFFLDDNETALKDMPDLVNALERLLGNLSAQTVNARSLHAQLLAAVGRYDEAVATQRANLQFAAQRQTVDGDALAGQRGILAVVLRAASRFEEGIEPASASLDFIDAKQPTPGWRGEHLRARLGDLQRGAGQMAAGLRNVQLAESRARTLPDHEVSPRYAEILVSLALAESADGRMDDAVRHARRALQIVTVASGPRAANTQRMTVLEAWLRALASAPSTVMTASLDAAAAAYSSSHPAPAALAELDLIRATVLARQGEAAKAQALRSTATAAWHAATGRDWRDPLVVCTERTARLRPSVIRLDQGCSLPAAGRARPARTAAKSTNQATDSPLAIAPALKT